MHLMKEDMKALQEKLLKETVNKIIFSFSLLRVYEQNIFGIF